MVMSENQAKARREGPSLASDESGAIMVAGLFASVFFVGVLYMLVGASSAMRHGQLMHDGADSASFSSAQMHAKGMNLIALGNMSTLSSVSILMTSSSVASGAADTLEWIASSPVRVATYGHTIPALSELIVTASEHYANADDLRQIIEDAEAMQNSLVQQRSAITEALVNEVLQPAYAPPVESFYLAPIRRSVPVEDEDLLETCARAIPYAEIMVTAAFAEIDDEVIQAAGLEFASEYFLPSCLVEGRSAKRVARGVLPGDEPWQLRFYATGQELSELGEKGVAVASRGSLEPDAASTLRDRLSRVSFAQSEYYLQGKTDSEDALWHMRWRARLKRFRPTQARPEIPAGMEQMIVH